MLRASYKMLLLGFALSPQVCSFRPGQARSRRPTRCRARTPVCLQLGRWFFSDTWCRSPSDISILYNLLWISSVLCNKYEFKRKPQDINRYSGTIRKILQMHTVTSKTVEFRKTQVYWGNQQEKYRQRNVVQIQPNQAFRQLTLSSWFTKLFYPTSITPKS